MLTLFYKPTCPYCQRVLGEAESLGIQFNLKDISADDAVAAELEEKGGKRQVPYLVDEDRGESMYESGDIIAYLQAHYATAGETKKEFGGLRIHKSDDACEVCE